MICRKAGVPRRTVHDLRHLAATISSTADVPLIVVSKTLRHSTLSTTANIYSHLTPQAARTAVNAIDATLTTAEQKVQLPKPRPPCDHNPRLHNQITVSKAPARAISYPNTPGTRPAHATTMRPQPPKTPKRPPPHLCGNGLRPAKTLVGTTGFEPATP
ncbi:tyrosine-type recombinase/integrase [Streptomyces cucumeris]|uniref:tyrosine-type recombinase/integrase n=1 Tax=Streptomyces cucumeris TaxID=2962890 RepID=UPI003D752C4A